MPHETSEPVQDVENDVRSTDGSFENAMNDADDGVFEVCAAENNSMRTEIEVISPILVEMLKQASINYPGIEYQDLFRSHVRLSEPFVILFYNIERIKELALEVDEPKARLLDMLLAFLAEQHSWTIHHKLDAHTCRTIAFEDLWLLYRPGTTVYRRPLVNSSSWRAFKIGCVSYHSAFGSDRSEFRLVYYSLAFDQSGTRLVPVKHDLALGPWIGERYIADLELIAAYCMTENQMLPLRASLEKRGRKYWSFKGKAAYQLYRGEAWPRNEEQVETKVIVDYFTPCKYMSPHLISVAADQFGTSSSDCHCPHCVRKYAALPSHPRDTSDTGRGCPNDIYPMFEPPFAYDDEELNPRTPFLYCPSHVDAFSLQHQSWKSVDISALADTSKSSQRLDSVVLVQKSKWLLTVLADANSNTSSDTTPGLTVLLQGISGTGKSTIAAALSEAKDKPLFILSWPDIAGKSLVDYDKCIKDAVFKAEAWGAILVIDHADTLLSSSAARETPVDNRPLVFLSILMHFRGIILLMVVDLNIQINPVISSRIDLAVQFPELNTNTRGRIWTNFIRAANTSSENKQALANITSSICSQNLNGHQMKKCLKTTLLLAKIDGSVQKKHIDLALAHDPDVLAIGTTLHPRSHLGGQSNLSDLEEGANSSETVTSLKPVPKLSPSLRSTFARPTSPGSPRSIRNLRFDSPVNGFPFPIVPTPLTETGTGLNAFSIPQSMYSSPGLLSPRSALSPPGSLLSPSIASSPPRSPRPMPRPGRMSTRPSMLRRHTTQSSLDPPVSDGSAPVEGGWTWKMLPAHVRRPQLQFEKGLPDTDDEGRAKGTKATKEEEEEGKTEGGGRSSRQGSKEKEKRKGSREL